MNLSLGFGLLAAMVFGWYEMNRADSIQIAFDAFKSAQTALADNQAVANKATEKRHADEIQTAVTARDLALTKLRNDQQRTRTDIVSVTPQSSETLCFQRAGFDAALRVFLTDVQGVAGEGDLALIDNKAWAEAWPK